MGKFSKVSFAVLCTANLGLTAYAQNTAVPQQAAPAQSGRNEQHLGAAQPGMAQHTEQGMIASCLVYDNQAEVALGRMAQKEAQSDAVKKFAGMMVQDHQEFLGKLQKFAPMAGELSMNHREHADSSKNAERNATGTRGNPDSSSKNQGGPDQGPDQGNEDQVNRNRNNQEQANNPNAGKQQVPGRAHDASVNVMKIQQELAQQCLSDTQAKLSKADGDEFDKCYVGMQIAMHGGMKSKLTVFSRHATGEFKQLLDQAIETTNTHLEKAESLMKDLDEESDSTRPAGRGADRAAPEKSEKR